MAQEDYFLKIEGVKGESQDDKHKDEIHVSSFSFGVTNAGTGGSNLGSGGGRSNSQDMHFTKVTPPRPTCSSPARPASTFPRLPSPCAAPARSRRNI
jgi:type VI secretion system secreted protein Hcp